MNIWSGGFGLFALYLLFSGNYLLFLGAIAFVFFNTSKVPKPWLNHKSNALVMACLLVFSVIVNGYNGIMAQQQQEAKRVAEQGAKLAEAQKRNIGKPRHIATQAPRPAKTPKPVPTKAPVQAQPEETPIEMFISVLKTKGLIGESGFISDVTFESDNKRAVLTVSNVWHMQAKQIRLQAAQNLWKQWAIICVNQAVGNNADACPIKLIDNNGNDVGGSSFMGGSLVSVID
jgi:hypothetical protein